MQSHLSIAGRSSHVPTHTTLRHDLATQGQVHRAGLDIVAMGKDETLDAFLPRLVMDCTRSPAALCLLAHVIMPDDAQRWSPSTADEVAAYLGSVGTDPDDSDTLQRAVTAMLEGMVRSGQLQIMQG